MKHRILLVIFLCCICSTLPLPLWSDTGKGLVYFNEAQRIMWSGGNYNDAMKNYIRFLESNANDSAYLYQLSVAEINMGVIHNYYKNPAKSIFYTKKAYTHALKNNDDDRQWSALNNLSLYYILLGQLDNAERYRKKILDLHTSESGKPLYGFASIGANIAYAKGDSTAFMDNIRLTRKIIRRYNLDSIYNSYCDRLMAKFFINRGMNDSALFYQKRFHNHIKTSRRIFLISESLQLLSGLYFATGDMRNAAVTQNEYTRLTDSLSNPVEFSKISYTYDRDLELTRQRELDDMKSRIRHQKAMIAGIACLSICALLFLFYILKKQKRKKQARKAGTIKKDCTGILSYDAGEDTIYENICRLLADPATIGSPEFSLARLSVLTGVHTAKISKIINKRHGAGVRTMINEYKIKEVCRRMLDNDNYGSYTIMAIAETMGYTSQAHFNRIFKSVTGETPSQWMKNHANKGETAQKTNPNTKKDL